MQAHHKKIALLQMTVLSKKLVGHANVITEAADHVFALLFKHNSNEFFFWARLQSRINLHF